MAEEALAKIFQQVQANLKDPVSRSNFPLVFHYANLNSNLILERDKAIDCEEARVCFHGPRAA